MYLEQLLEMTPEERYLKLWDFAPSERLLAKRELEAYIRRSPPHPAWPGLIGAVVGIGLNGLLQASGYWTVLYSGMLGLGALSSLFWFAMSLARQAANERDWPVVAALAEDIVEIQEQMNLPLGGYAGLRPGYLEDLADDLDAHVYAHNSSPGMTTLSFTWETLPKPVIAQAQRIFDIAPTNPKIREWAKKYIGAARVDSFRTPGGASIKHDPTLEIRKLMKDHAGSSVHDQLCQVPIDPEGGMPEGHIVGIAGDGKGNTSLLMRKRAEIQGTHRSIGAHLAGVQAEVDRALAAQGTTREEVLARAAEGLEFHTVDELVARGTPPGRLVEVPRRPRTPVELMGGSYLDYENSPERTEAALRGEPLPPMEPVHTGFAPALHSEPPAYHSPTVEHHSVHDYSAPADHHHDTTGGDFGSGSYE